MIKNADKDSVMERIRNVNRESVCTYDLEIVILFMNFLNFLRYIKTFHESEKKFCFFYCLFYDGY